LDCKLHPFRPGVFKVAHKAGVPIVVCTIRNTHKIIPNAKKFKPTHVHLHILDVLPPEEIKGHTTVQISDRIHAIMAQDLGPSLLASD
jgi:1-acyl-sn-glycerol-3-phosphate acyltransferase